MAGLAHDVAGLVLEELKRGDGPRSVELRLGKAEQYAADPLLVIAPSVDKGRTKLDVYTQWGHECEGRKASGLSVDGALHLALADAQARGHHGVLAGIYKDREWPPVAEVWVPLDKEEETEATLRRLVKVVRE